MRILWSVSVWSVYPEQHLAILCSCSSQIIDLPVKACPHAAAIQNKLLEPVRLNSGNKLHRLDDGKQIGTLESRAAEALFILGADGQLELQLSYSAISEPCKGQSRKLAGSLNVILYGPKDLADDVGDFVGKCGYYLQDPSGCDRDVPYCNPQCLSSLDGDLPMTFDLHQHYHVDNFTRATNDIFSGFETTEVLAQTRTPSALRTQLRA